MSDTYERFALTSLIPAQGWQAVYVHEQGGHITSPVHALALAYRRRYEVGTKRLMPSYPEGPEDERWEIVALEYFPGSGWSVCQGQWENCCGLLPPGWSLAMFEMTCHCHANHTPE